MEKHRFIPMFARLLQHHRNKYASPQPHPSLLSYLRLCRQRALTGLGRRPQRRTLGVLERLHAHLGRQLGAFALTTREGGRV